MVELGLLVYSVAMSGVWLRTYQGCIGKKDDGHLIIYDFGLFDPQKTSRRFGVSNTYLFKKKTIVKIQNSSRIHIMSVNY